MFNLKDKNIIVTGGAGHLGSAISEGLAKFDANVIIVSKNKENCVNLAEKLNEKYNTNCQGYEIDISDTSSIQQTFKKIVDLNGKIDVLVNNASFGASGLIEEMSEDEWLRGIDGSINSVYRTTREALKYMMPNKEGNIINISSMYGVVSPNPSIYEGNNFGNPANYGAGKAAIIQFSKYLAAHYGSGGIRANTISPGPFPKPEIQEDKQFIQRLSDKTALGRIGKPKDLQGAIVFLSSDASGYVTGQNICVDGGWTAW